MPLQFDSTLNLRKKLKKIIAVCIATLILLCAQINFKGAKAHDDAIVAYNEKRFKDAAKLLKISLATALTSHFYTKRAKA